MGGLLLEGRGRLTSAVYRLKAIELISEGHAAGASLVKAFSEIGICLRTLKRWSKAVIGDGVGHDRRKRSPRRILHRLSEEKRQRILPTCNHTQYAELQQGQIVPAPADQGRYNSSGIDIVYASESSYYRVLHAHGQAHLRGRARRHWNRDQCQGSGPQGPIRSGAATSPICPSPCAGSGCTSTCVIDILNRKVVALDVDEREDPAIASDLVSRSCLRERVSKRRKQPLILHADNGNLCVRPRWRAG